MKEIIRGISAFHITVRGIKFFALLLAVSQLLAIPKASAWGIEGEEWYGPTEKGAIGGEGAYSAESSGAGAFAGTQNVFFNFDSATAGFDHVYTVAERDAIVAGVAAIYAPWDFTFSHTVVPAGAFATLIFNSGPTGGLASDLDFRNLALGGSGTIDVNAILGLAPSAAYIGLTTTIGAHELGHLVGLRHADSLGAIGFGLSPTGPSPLGYLPDYPGPLLAVETTGHTMASPASVGQSLPEAIAGSYMGERAAVKLEFNEVGTVSPEVGVAHGTHLLAQPMTLPSYPVPNTAVLGDVNFGMNLYADAEVVTGSITAAGQLDYYSFTGTAGDVMNAEVISNVPNRFGAADIDSIITMFMPDGITPVTQGLGIALNDDEFESLDSALIDVVLPVTGTYYVRIGTFGFGDTGGYDLYLYRFRAEVVPEPAALSLLMLGAFLAAGSIRRARRSSLKG